MNILQYLNKKNLNKTFCNYDDKKSVVGLTCDGDISLNSIIFNNKTENDSSETVFLSEVDIYDVNEITGKHKVVRLTFSEDVHKALEFYNPEHYYHFMSSMVSDYKYGLIDKEVSVFLDIDMGSTFKSIEITTYDVFKLLVEEALKCYFIEIKNSLNIVSDSECGYIISGRIEDYDELLKFDEDFYLYEIRKCEESGRYEFVFTNELQSKLLLSDCDDRGLIIDKLIGISSSYDKVNPVKLADLKVYKDKNLVISKTDELHNLIRFLIKTKSVGVKFSKEIKFI